MSSCLQSLDAVQLSFARPHIGRAVEDHPCPLERDEPSADHLVEVGENRLDRFLGFHDFDDEREIEREAQDFLRVNDARGPEAGHTPEHCRASKSLLAELLEERLVQRLATVLVALTDEDPHQRAFALELVRHGDLAFAYSSRFASANPATVARRHPNTVPPTYSPACKYSPSVR